MSNQDNNSDFEPLIIGNAPWFVKMVPFLRELWSNAIFQRNYVRTHSGAPANHKLVFFGSLLFSILVCAGILIATEADWEMSILGSGITLIIILQIIYLVATIRVFIMCLISTPATTKTNLGAEQPDPFLSTPISDRDVFYGEVFPNIVRGLEVCQSYALVTIGLCIPFYLINAVPYVFIEMITMDFMDQGSAIVLVIFAAPLFLLAMALAILQILLMMLLISFASGMYSLKFATFGSVVASLVHYFVVTNVIAGNVAQVILGFTFMPFSMFGMGRGFEGVEMIIALLGYIGSILAILILVIAGIWVTSKMGISAVGKFRREGVYMPTPVYRSDGNLNQPDASTGT